MTYASPELAGLKFYAQYSFQPDTKESHGGNVKAQEGKSTADRQISIALTYGIGNLELIGIAQTNKWSNLPRGTGTAIDWREKKDATTSSSVQRMTSASPRSTLPVNTTITCASSLGQYHP